MKEKILHVLMAKYKVRILDFFSCHFYEDEAFGKPWTILLTETTIMFAESKDEPPELAFKNEIQFDMIKQIVMAKNSYFSLRIDLFGPYFRTTPKVFIAINNRRSFLLKLKTAFKTYNLIRRLEAKNLPVFLDNLDKEVIKNLPKEYFRLRKIHFLDPEKWHQSEHMGYSFVLPRFMVSHPQQKNIYYFCKNPNSPKEVKDASELDQKNFFSFQVSRNIPLAVKESMGPKKNLEFYAYDLLIEWLGFKNKGFTVDESTTYQKRLHLTNDSSQWSGHYIKAIGWDNNSHTNEIFYIMVFRRCYVPPMLDIFDDIVCMGMLTWKEEEKTSNASSVARRTQDLYMFTNHEGETGVLSLAGNTQLQDRIFLTFADSVTCVEDQYPVPKDYIAYISQVVNSLGKFCFSDNR